MKLKIIFPLLGFLFFATPTLAYYDYEENFDTGGQVNNYADWSCHTSWVSASSKVNWGDNSCSWSDSAVGIEYYTYGTLSIYRNTKNNYSWNIYDDGGYPIIQFATNYVTGRLTATTLSGSQYWLITSYTWNQVEWELFEDTHTISFRFAGGSWTTPVSYGDTHSLATAIVFSSTYNNTLYPQYFDTLGLTRAIMTVPFEITSPSSSASVINDEYITVSGTCSTNGENRIGLTNNCLGFNDIEYTLACTDNTFSGQFFKSGSTNNVIARDIDSVSGDCVDYDELMDFIQVGGFNAVNGYPNDWYFNFEYYDDYDIRIKSPAFDTALNLPAGSTSTNFTFGFIYPSGQLANLNFNIKQYDSSSNLLNANYFNEDLSNMADTWNYTVNLVASSTQGLHYVVQLTESGEMKRQFPFGVYVSDLDFIFNRDDYDYFFPRLVEELKKKIIFNYYFAFHDGFYSMFHGTYTVASDDALDITFKSVSGDGEYDMDIKIFSASDTRVKSFAIALRPYTVAVLWLGFALYVVFRITHLFTDNE